MLRFCRKDAIRADNIQVIIQEEHVVLSADVWAGAREYLRCGIDDDADIVRLLPVTDEKQDIVCYAYEDDEADRELRMLKELSRMKEALQFEDIFPHIDKVIIHGCNELAYGLAKYLKSRQIRVCTMGKYWDWMGYADETGYDMHDESTLIVHAEEAFGSLDLGCAVIRSASPAFECIDRIYEANVKKGIIKDTGYGAETLWERLKGKKILILGTTLKAQDVYDLLCAHGIDITAFVEERPTGYQRNGCRTLLGKKIVSLGQAVSLWRDAVFIDCAGRNSALGNRYVESLNRLGYERNGQMFLISDYTDIPFSNLVHVMCGKKVSLTGDAHLCRMLSQYLHLVEAGEVEVRYIPLGEKVPEEDGIRCLVVPHCKNQRSDVDAANARMRDELLADMGFDGYTEYFMRHRAIILIDRYLNRSREKYTVKELTPKGMMLGRIPPYSGNFFFRGILDGHPEILMIPYSDLNNNLFYYCIRLAGCDRDEILSGFWELYDTEAASRDRFFTDIDRFEASFNRLLSHKETYTSQELFIMFHIAYAEMMSGKQTSDVSGLVLYWEPHYVSRDEFPFLELWLEDEKINGHTIRLRRNNMMRTGSSCERAQTGRYYAKTAMFHVMFSEEMDSDTVGQRCERKYWTEHKMRFEDLKVYPRDNILEICGWLDIPWSESMMRTTRLGEAQSYRGSMDFDLQPVFKKSESLLSEFDRFRISIACSPYQKKYGYTYEDCMRFSRKELQEMFLRPFLFEEEGSIEISARDRMEIYRRIGWDLWEVRKHRVLDDVCPEFGRFELRQTGKR